MDFIDISKMRVTVRKFDPKPVEQDKTLKILKAGFYSQSKNERKAQSSGKISVVEQI